jgi:hypothetical protein
MANPQLQKVPFEIKDGLIKTLFVTAKIKFSEDEMTDLAAGINAEINSIVQDGLGFLNDHKDALKGVSDL